MMHPEAMNTFIYSIGIAIITTLACLLLGYPAAYILSQKQFNTSQTMVVLFILPMWVNILIRTLATVALFDFLNHVAKTQNGEKETRNDLVCRLLLEKKKQTEQRNNNQNN